MVTKATVEKIISNEEISVNIPAYDIVEEGTDEEELSSSQVARISCPPGFIPDFTVGDTVFVCIEDNDLGEPVVMGKLLLDGCSEDSVGSSRATLSKLKVTGATKLSKDTNIGEVTDKHILCLKDARSNIQEQLDTQLSYKKNYWRNLQTN
jgi:hypothetical protein